MRELLALYADKGEGAAVREENFRWVVWTPEGYYMASPGGENLIGWHVNAGLETPAFYSAGRFRERFHRPDVVTLVLDELDVAKALARADAEARVESTRQPTVLESLPPTLRILEPSAGAQVAGDLVRIVFRVDDVEGAPIPALKVTVNGVVASGVGGGGALPRNGWRSHVEVPVRPFARDGKASITLVAEGRHGESDPASVQITVPGAAPDVPKPTLWVLAVGVSTYKNTPPTDLKYAVKDVVDVVNALQDQRGHLYGDVQYRPLSDGDAWAEDVVNGLYWLRDNVAQNDVVIVFLSGHGAVERQVYYFFPFDADLRTAASINRTCVSEHELAENLRAVYERGTKVMAFFDTCYSGAFTGAKSGPPDLERMAADLASEANGVVVFTAASANEIAYEDPEWANGALTEVLLRTLQGRTAKGELRITDLSRIIKREVPKLTSGRQHPKIYLPQEELADWPIAVVQP